MAMGIRIVDSKTRLPTNSSIMQHQQKASNRQLDPLHNIQKTLDDTNVRSETFPTNMPSEIVQISTAAYNA